MTWRTLTSRPRPDSNNQCHRPKYPVATLTLKKALAVVLSLFCAPLSRPAEAKEGDRPPAAAGSFYPAEKDALLKTIDGLLADAKAPAPEGTLIGMIVPHAGYAYCGGVLAEAARRAKGAWDTIILLGPSHKMPVTAAAVYSRGAFVTPLGRAAVNAAFATELLADPRFKADTWTHSQEHSLEVPLPFLQKVSPKSKILPIVVNNGDPKFVEQAGRALGKLLKRPGVFLIVSSDLSHYPSRETGWAADLTFLRALESMDEEKIRLADQAVLARREPNLVTNACGYAAVLIGLKAARAAGADRAVVLKRGSSADATGADAQRTVGYAAVALTRGKTPPAKLTLTAEQKKKLLEAARASVADGATGRSYGTMPLSEDPDMNLPGAVFVTIWKGGALRGCMGGLRPDRGLLEAVRASARMAAFEDKRFRPVAAEEMPALRFDVSRIGDVKRAPSAEAVTAGRDGASVRKGDKFGVFLPDVWKTHPNKADFLSKLCSEKAGLPADCWKDPKVELSTFQTESFQE